MTDHAQLPSRGCRHHPLRPRECPECSAFLDALAQLKRDVVKQQRAERGGPSIRELRAANQARIRSERGQP